MAGFRTHLGVAAGLGFVYGGLGASQIHLPPTTAVLGASLTAIGGLMPDLDSDSGIPIRELFGLASAVAPLLLMPRLSGAQLSHEDIILFLVCVYALIRYGFSRFFKRITVHRGMFHSIPGMLIAGMLVFLGYESPDWKIRVYFASAVMLGFLSHLVLDEIYSVDFRGLKIKLNKFAGSAVKFASPSTIATLTTYAIAIGLGYLTWLDVQKIQGK